MRASRSRRASFSPLNYEVCEERLYLSVEPVALISPEQLVADTQDIQTTGATTTSASATDSTSPAQVLAQYGLAGSGQTVVVIDTGIAYNHEALGGGYGEGYVVVGGYDFAENDADPYDDTNGHGTVVAGILTGDSQYINSLASDVDLVALRVFDDSGYCNITWVEEALQWVHDNISSFENPITTVNLSLGVNLTGEELASISVLEDELAQLVSDGIFISVAAGNSFATYGTTGLAYPASSPYVVAVSSVDADGSMSYYAQRDAGVIAAPGRSILSSVPDYLGDGNGLDDDYARYSGTSMAAPYVAAASTLLREAYEAVGNANVDQERLYQTMVDTADSVYDSTTGLSYYRLNLARAIETVMALAVAQQTTDEPAATTEETPTTEETEVVQSEISQQSDPVQTEPDTGSDEQCGTGETAVAEDSSTGDADPQDPVTAPVDEIVTQDPADTPVSEPVVQDPVDTPVDEVVAQDPANTPVSEPIVQTPAASSPDETVVQDSDDNPADAIVTQDPVDAPLDQVVVQDPGDTPIAGNTSNSGASGSLPVDNPTGQAGATERIEQDQASSAASRVPFWFSHSDVRPGMVWLVSKYSVTLFPTGQGLEPSVSPSGAPYDLGLGELWSSGQASAKPQPNQGALDWRATDWLYGMDRPGGQWQEVEGLNEIVSESLSQPARHTVEYPQSADVVWETESDLWQAA